MPFKVKNIQTDQSLEEAAGHVMDVAARGSINQTGSFVGSAMICLAASVAGVPREKIYSIHHGNAHCTVEVPPSDEGYRGDVVT